MTHQDIEKLTAAIESITASERSAALVRAVERIADAMEQNTAAVITHNELVRTTNSRLAWIDEALTGKIRQPKVETPKAG